MIGNREINLAAATAVAPMQAAGGVILCVVGARANYLKMAPLLRALADTPGAPPTLLVHTGQHYDPAFKDRLFDDLRMRLPDENLDAGSGSHAVRTAEVMGRFEPLIDRYQPCCVVVIGDVASTLACSLVASKRGVPVAHVEAGLRSHDRGTPEEIDRVLADQISDLLYTADREADANLEREGVTPARVVFAGNRMIDSLHDALPRAKAPELTLRDSRADLGVVLGSGFALVALNHPSNVGDRAVLAELVELLRSASERLGLVWPIHPRAREQLERFGLLHRLVHPRIVCVPPQGYLEMLGLMRAARVVITDSGGVQEETPALGIPCLTMCDNTERPITVTQGTNRLMKRDVTALHAALDDLLSGTKVAKPVPEGWDGHSGRRIASHLVAWLAQPRSRAAALTFSAPILVSTALHHA